MNDQYDITNAIKQNATNQKKIEKYFDDELGEMDYEVKEKEAHIINDIQIDNKKVQNVILDFSSAGFTLEQFQNNKKDFFETLKRIIRIQGEIVESLYSETLELCNEWEEVDDNENPITLEYVKKHISIEFLNIYNDSAQIQATIKTDETNENDSRWLLGEHFIEALIEKDDIEIKWNLA